MNGGRGKRYKRARCRLDRLCRRFLPARLRAKGTSGVGLDCVFLGGDGNVLWQRVHLWRGERCQIDPSSMGGGCELNGGARGHGDGCIGRLALQAGLRVLEVSVLIIGLLYCNCHAGLVVVRLIVFWKVVAILSLVHVRQSPQSTQARIGVSLVGDDWGIDSRRCHLRLNSFLGVLRIVVCGNCWVCGSSVFRRRCFHFDLARSGFDTAGMKLESSDAASRLNRAENSAVKDGVCFVCVRRERGGWVGEQEGVEEPGSRPRLLRSPRAWLPSTCIRHPTTAPGIPN
jgi:hypothetical protein